MHLNLFCCLVFLILCFIGALIVAPVYRHGTAYQYQHSHHTGAPLQTVPTLSSVNTFLEAAHFANQLGRSRFLTLFTGYLTSEVTVCPRNCRLAPDCRDIAASVRRCGG